MLAMLVGMIPGMSMTLSAEGAANPNSIKPLNLTGTRNITPVSKPEQTISAPDVCCAFGDTGLRIKAFVTEPNTGGGTLSYAVKSGDAVTVDATTGELTIVKAGSTVITVTAEETGEYAQTTKDVNVTVNKAAPSVTAPTPRTMTYDTYAHDLVDAGSTGDGTLYYAVTTEVTPPEDETLYTTSVPTGLEVGTYYVWYCVKGDSNHANTTPIAVSVTIGAPETHLHRWTYAVDGQDPGRIVSRCLGYGECDMGEKSLAIAAPTDLTYDNTQKAAAITDYTILDTGITSGGISDIFYQGVGDTAFARSTTAPRNAGTYTASVTVTPPEGRGDPVTAQVKYTVLKAAIDGTPLTAEQKPQARSGLVYTGEAQALVSAPNRRPDGCIGSRYSVDGGETWTDALPTGANAGSYPVRVKYLGDANHEDLEISDADDNALLARINKGDFSPKVEVLNKTYDGKAVTLTISDNPGNGTITSTQYEKKAGEETWSSISGAPTDAGTYRVMSTIAETDNYNGATTNTCEFVIYRANPVVTAPMAEDLRYSGTAQALITAGSTTGGTMLYSLDGQSFSDSVPTAVNAGTYTVYYRVEGNGNYNGAGPKCLQVQIRERFLQPDTDFDVTLSKNEFVYNKVEQKPTVTIRLKDGVALTQGTDFDVTYTADTTNAGDKKAVITFEGDYAGDPVEVDYKITPKPLKEGDVTFTGSSFTYDGSAQGPAIIVKDGDDTLTIGKDYRVEGGTATDANPYTATVTGSGNYIGTVTGNFTITKAGLNADSLTDEQKPAALTGLVYSGAAQALVNAPASVPAGYAMQYSLDDATWRAALPSSKDAGTYNVYVKYKGDDNHADAVLSNTISVTIARKAVTITPQAGQTKVYGTADPATFTYAQDGVVSGDTLTGKLGRVDGDNVGEYPFSIAGFIASGANPNYDIALANCAPEFSITMANQPTPEAPILTATSGSVTVTNGKQGVTYKLYDGNDNYISEKDMTPTSDGSFTFNDLNPAEQYTVRAQIDGDDNHNASGVSQATITTPKEVQSAPNPWLQKGASSQAATDGIITNVNDTMEYSVNDGETWVPVPLNNTQITGLAPGEVLVRYEGDNTKEPSDPARVMVTFRLSGKVKWHYTYNYVDPESGDPKQGTLPDNERSMYARVQLCNGAIPIKRTPEIVDASENASGDTAKGTYSFNGLPTADSAGNRIDYRVEVTPLMSDGPTDEASGYSVNYIDVMHTEAEIYFNKECFDAPWKVTVQSIDAPNGAQRCMRQGASEHG